ncbi:hypothetical protein PoB_004954100 [Plakobranchus ocellatus]|uniref:Uncharacterized protein n=1 Tax=Plakobranchus ocellatus TaxID=259542 RepID=A0AAV4BI65_9GAST|nr:hypothetical protein PoB_004954100 [Plakobranchus ocellatus]
MQYKYFAQERSTPSSCQTEGDTVGLPRLRVVFVGNKKKRFCIFCPSAGRWPVTAQEGGLTSAVRPSCHDQGGKNYAVVPLASHAVNQQDQAPAFMSEAKQQVKQSPKTAEYFIF